MLCTSSLQGLADAGICLTDKLMKHCKIMVDFHQETVMHETFNTQSCAVSVGL